MELSDIINLSVLPEMNLHIPYVPPKAPAEVWGKLDKRNLKSTSNNSVSQIVGQFYMCVRAHTHTYTHTHTHTHKEQGEESIYQHSSRETKHRTERNVQE